MRAYYFTSQEVAMDHILPERRMKLSLVHELNDPFELLSAQLTSKDMRKVTKSLHAHWTQTKGVICFNDSMRSPLMWAHCAIKHYSMCLGFDIPSNPDDFDNSIIRPMDYTPKRLQFELAQLQASARVPHYGGPERARSEWLVLRGFRPSNVAARSDHRLSQQVVTPAGGSEGPRPSGVSQDP